MRVSVECLVLGGLFILIMFFYVRFGKYRRRKGGKNIKVGGLGSVVKLWYGYCIRYV